MTARLALSPDEIESRWPRCRTVIADDGVLRVVHGRLVGKTAEAVRRFDVLTDDGEILKDIPETRVFIIGEAS